MENQVVEAKATAEDSESIDAVTGAGGEVKKRLADKELKNPQAADEVEKTEKTVKTPQGTNNAGLHEAVKGLFEGEEFSPEFKEKVAVVFEAAVNERAAQIKEAVEAEFVTKLDEETTKIESELSEKVEKFLDFSAGKWLEENATAIESGIKVEIAESLLEGLKTMFVEHNVVVDEKTVDTIQEMSDELDSERKKFTGAVLENADLKKQMVELKNQMAFQTVTEGLADTQVEKLRALAESITFESTEDYTSKIKSIRESFFAEAAPVVADVAEELNEDVSAPKTKSSGNSDIDVLAASLGRYSGSRI
jgi:hypothetical protein